MGLVKPGVDCFFNKCFRQGGQTEPLQFQPFELRIPMSNILE